MLTIAQASAPEARPVTARRIGETRGFFSEASNRRRFANAGMDLDFVQDCAAPRLQPTRDFGR